MEERKIKEELFREIKRRGLMEQEDDDEVGEPKKNDFCEMVCKILHSRNQSHIFHLQTKSYSEHKALNDYYDNIVDLYDGLIESYQGKYGILEDVKTYENVNYKSKDQIIDFFDNLTKEIESLRKSIKDSFLQNQVDTILELLFSTLYKLKFLN
jgi:hypothetical protein|tara:strand:- start:1152 stop:1613 length:462 start_codon:yes stop_codon:yes gene_type:complete